MPIRMSDVLKETRTETFEYSGEQVTVEFRQNALTPQFSEMVLRFTELENEEGTGRLRLESELSGELVEALVWLMTEWDVLGDNGKPLPITKANLRRLPTSFLFALLAALLGVNRPNEASVGS